LSTPGAAATPLARAGHRMLKPGSTAFTVLLGALIAISPFAMDIYLSSMPSMGASLGTTATRVQLTLSVYMYGLGAAQLVAGPLSDRFGRRRVLIAGIAVFAAASLACAAAPNVEALIAMRLVQALAVAVCGTVPRALVRDLHSGDDAAHLLSLMGVVLGVAPIVAPIIGGQLQVAFGWRSTFAFVTLYALVALVAVWRGLPETLRDADHRAIAPATMLRNFATCFASRVYVGYFLVACFAFCGLFAFLAGSSFVFEAVMGHGAREFGFLFGAVMLGNVSGAVISSRVVRRFGIDRVIRVAASLALVAGASMAALAWMDVRHPAAVVVPMFVYMIGLMLTAPQAMAGAMTPFPRMAGAATSLLAFGQFLFGSTSALIVGLTYDHTSRPMATTIGVSALLTFVASRALIRAPH
jgi:DHA1 family bicyclomycin/chloramphenicol resistance-like MFS transporter